MKSKVIVALDVPKEDAALEIVDELGGNCAGYKIGKRLFTACGHGIVGKVIGRDGKVFLDLKYHDIPNTVAEASIEACNLGVSMFNMHALGGFEMMEKAVEDVAKHFENSMLIRPNMLAVTILTSSNFKTFARMGLVPASINDEDERKKWIKDLVVRLALMAKEAGMDGVVASPEEASMLREECGKGFLIVTPGIRPANADADDQVRIATPSAAIKNGADYLVIGRPIIGKPKGERLAALQAINAEVAQASAEM
jgi:orotidine-5'-phosphate decarboxylase